MAMVGDAGTEQIENVCNARHMVAKYDSCNAVVWIMRRDNEKAGNTEHQYDRKEMTDLVSGYTHHQCRVQS